MIFIGTDDAHRIIVIEPGNIDRLKEGKPLIAPDGTLIVFTNDAKWTAEQIVEMLKTMEGEFDAKLLDFIFKEGVKRPEVKR